MLRLFRRCAQAWIPLYFDGLPVCRERVFHQAARAGYADKTPKQIAQEMFALGDGCTMSAKKDGMANIGGFLCTNDEILARQEQNLLILTEGYPTYGGLSGRDLEAVAIACKSRWKRTTCAIGLRRQLTLATILPNMACDVQPPADTQSISMRRRFFRTFRWSSFRGLRWPRSCILKVAYGRWRLAAYVCRSRTDGTGAAGDSAPHVHAEPYRLCCRDYLEGVGAAAQIKGCG